jgi:hypothetical protein
MSSVAGVRPRTSSYCTYVVLAPGSMKTRFSRRASPHAYVHTGVVPSSRKRSSSR